MKNLNKMLLLTLLSLASCTTDSVEEVINVKPEHTKSDVTFLIDSDARLTLIDFNNSVPDTLVDTVGSFYIPLYDRGYYQVIVENNSPKVTTLQIVNNGHIIKDFDSQIPVVGATVQFFNKY